MLACEEKDVAFNIFKSHDLMLSFCIFILLKIRCVLCVFILGQEMTLQCWFKVYIDICLWHFLTLTWKMWKNLFLLLFKNLFFFFFKKFWGVRFVCVLGVHGFVISLSALFLDLYMFTQNKGYNCQFDIYLFINCFHILSHQRLTTWSDTGQIRPPQSMFNVIVFNQWAQGTSFWPCQPEVSPAFVLSIFMYFFTHAQGT